MEEIIKVSIFITDEGIICINGITADYEAVDDMIENYSIEMYFASKNAYDSFYEGYKEYLQTKSTVADIHKKLDFVKFIYDYQQDLAKQTINSCLKAIEAASEILNITIEDTYNRIVERLKLLNHD